MTLGGNELVSSCLATMQRIYQRVTAALELQKRVENLRRCMPVKGSETKPLDSGCRSGECTPCNFPTQHASRIEPLYSFDYPLEVESF